KIGFYLLKKAPKIELESVYFWRDDISISPQDANYTKSDARTFPDGGIIYALQPHMHLRGRSMQIEALFPDGTRNTLLSVPNYDMFWQRQYYLEKPLALPKGTVLMTTGTYDNSPNNPRNPDPNARVHFGPQSTDEMFEAIIWLGHPHR